MKGFTLIEVLVAMALIVVAGSGLAQLVTLASRTNAESRADAVATFAAQSKLATLRALSWSVDPSTGATRSDISTDLTVDPPAPGGRGLSLSPSSSLTTNTAGFVDYVDAAGAYAGTGTTPPVRAVYIRRWSVEPLQRDPANVLVLQVAVARVGHPAATDVRLISLLARAGR